MIANLDIEALIWSKISNTMDIHTRPHLFLRSALVALLLLLAHRIMAQFDIQKWEKSLQK